MVRKSRAKGKRSPVRKSRPSVKQKRAKAARAKQRTILKGMAKAQEALNAKQTKLTDSEE